MALHQTGDKPLLELMINVNQASLSQNELKRFYPTGKKALLYQD